MSLISEQFKKARIDFEKTIAKDDGNQIMQKVVELVNRLGENFTKLDGGSLAEIQMKLAGYKFYLADYMADLQQTSEALKLDIKEQWAKSWDEVSENIKAEKGKVSNKQQIENILIINTRGVANEQILYETQFNKYKIRISAINDILTAVVQRISELKQQVEQSKIN